MKKFIYTTAFILFFFSCSTKKNKPLNKGYHSVVSSYNVLFNGNESIDQGLLETQSSFKENFWKILPIEKINLSNDIITVDGIENANFLKGEEKAAKTIQKHSMQIEGRQQNPKIADAYLLLGKARYLDQRFVPALDAFNQVYKQKLINEQWQLSVIWKAKSNIRLEQENLAIELLEGLLKQENLSKANKAYASATLAMAYLQLKKINKAIKPLKTAAELEQNKNNKVRYLYILGQLLEKESKIDSSNTIFKKIAGYKRKIPREFFVNATLKTLVYDTIKIKDKESQIIKMIDNYENEDFLDKIYFQYSILLFSSNSIVKGKKFLNKAIQENISDKDLLSKGYAKLSEIYFQNSDYLMAGKYLDSTMKNLDKESKLFWETQRKRKGLNQIIDLETKVALYDSLIKISYYDKEKLNQIINQINSSEIKIREERLNENKEKRPSNMRRTSSRKSNFYFYDDNLVKLGKSSFETLWGNRTRETYWRNSTSSSVNLGEKEKKIAEREEPKETQTPLQNTELLALIPTTKNQKDSINKLKNQSYLKLTELYLVKYKDYELVEKRLKNFIDPDLTIEFLAEANYLLFKLFKLIDEKSAQEVKRLIIKDFPDTKFSKILKNPNNLLIEENVFRQNLDSLQLLFDQQKFVQVISRVEKELIFIENKDLALDYELLKAYSVGRMEGILKYDEILKELIVKYPNSEKKSEIQRINTEINKKWKSKNKKIFLGKYFLIFAFEKEQYNKKILERVKSLMVGSSRVSQDVYDYNTTFIVIKDLENKEKANHTKEFLEENIALLRLKNNFVVLSSQYKNILIYKTLDLSKEN